MIVLIRGFVEVKEGSSELFDYFRFVIMKDIKVLSVVNICEVLWCFFEGKFIGNRLDVFRIIVEEIFCRGIVSFNIV